MCSFGASSSESSKNESKYGTRTGIAGDEWKAAFKNFSGGVNSAGVNPNQQYAIDVTKNALDNNATRSTREATNRDFGDYQTEYANMNANLNGLATAAPRQLGAAPSSAVAMSDASTSAGTSTIDAPTAISGMAPYANFFGSQFVDPALKAYDYGTDRAFSAMDARTAGAGAFGNSRSGLGYSDLGAQAGLGRGQLASGLLQTGIGQALGAATGDVNRQYGANTGNASNTLDNNKFNAGLLTQNNQFNAGQETQNNQFNTGIQDARDKFNVDAGYKGDAVRMAALDKMAGNIAARTGLSQQVLQNVIDENGVNLANAEALFKAGTITQAQLQQITQEAAATNGYKFDENTSGTTTGSSSNFGFG